MEGFRVAGIPGSHLWTLERSNAATVDEMQYISVPPGSALLLSHGLWHGGLSHGDTSLLGSEAARQRALDARAYLCRPWVESVIYDGGEDVAEQQRLRALDQLVSERQSRRNMVTTVGEALAFAAPVTEDAEWVSGDLSHVVERLGWPAMSAYNADAPEAPACVVTRGRGGRAEARGRAEKRSRNRRSRAQRTCSCGACRFAGPCSS